MKHIRRVGTGNDRSQVIIEKMNENDSPYIIGFHIDEAKEYSVGDAGNELADKHNDALFWRYIVKEIYRQVP